MSIFTLVIAVLVSAMLVYKMSISNWWMVVVVPMVLVFGALMICVLKMLVPLILLAIVLLVAFVVITMINASKEVGMKDDNMM